MQLSVTMRTEIELDSSDSNVVYYGVAAAEALTSEAVWQIKKIYENGAVVYADGNDQHDNTWDNRESLNYPRG